MNATTNELSNSRNKILFIWENVKLWLCDMQSCCIDNKKKNEPNTLTLKNSYMHLEVNSIWQGLIDVNILIWHSQQALFIKSYIVAIYYSHYFFIHFNIFLILKKFAQLRMNQNKHFTHTNMSDSSGFHLHIHWI